MATRATPNGSPDDERQFRIEDTLLDQFVSGVVPWIGKTEHQADSQLAVGIWEQLVTELEAYLRATTATAGDYVIANEGYLNRHFYRRDGSLHVTVQYDYPTGGGRPAVEFRARSYANNYSQETIAALEAKLDGETQGRPRHLADLDALERIASRQTGLFGRRISTWPRWL